MRKFSHVLLLVLLPIFVMAQHTVSGTVTNAATGDALPGANVVVDGTSMGAAAAADGSYSISRSPTWLTGYSNEIEYNTQCLCNPTGRRRW